MITTCTTKQKTNRQSDPRNVLDDSGNNKGLVQTHLVDTYTLFKKTVWSYNQEDYNVTINLFY